MKIDLLKRCRRTLYFPNISLNLTLQRQQLSINPNKLRLECINQIARVIIWMSHQLMLFNKSVEFPPYSKVIIRH